MGKLSYTFTHTGTLFLTVVDDFSREVWVVLLKHKHEANHHMVTLCNIIETQFGRNVKRIMSENGREFTSGFINDFYSCK